MTTIKTIEVPEEGNKLSISECFKFCSFDGTTYDIDKATFKSGNIIVLDVSRDVVRSVFNTDSNKITTTITITETKETFNLLMALYMKRKNAIKK